MSKKFSIIKTLDINKLENEIEKYMCINNETNPYIFMSDETVGAIMQQLEPISCFDTRAKEQCVSEGKIGTYAGYRVFINNDLKFGKIEIR